jgi:hypothetical protein
LSLTIAERRRDEIAQEDRVGTALLIRAVKRFSKSVGEMVG